MSGIHSTRQPKLVVEKGNPIEFSPGTSRKLGWSLVDLDTRTSPRPIPGSDTVIASMLCCLLSPGSRRPRPFPKSHWFYIVSVILRVSPRTATPHRPCALH